MPHSSRYRVSARNELARTGTRTNRKRDGALVPWGSVRSGARSISSIISAYTLAKIPA